MLTKKEKIELDKRRKALELKIKEENRLKVLDEVKNKWQAALERDLPKIYLPLTYRVDENLIDVDFNDYKKIFRELLKDCGYKITWDKVPWTVTIS